MTDQEKLNSVKDWIEKLAKGINPLNNNPVKDDDIINNVHISRCLFYVSKLLDEITYSTSYEKGKKHFNLSANAAATIPITEPNGINNFVKLVNGYIPAGVKPLSTALVLKWLKLMDFLREVSKEDGHKTNLPTEKGNLIGIKVVVQKNLDGTERQRVVYSIEAQRFILNNIELIAALQ